MWSHLFSLVAGSILILIASGISNASGVGGGLLILPILYVVMRFYPNEAIPLSKVIIFFGSLAAFIQNIKLQRPGRNSKAFDYNIIILCSPNLLLGTALGITLYGIIPITLIIVLLGLLLVFYAYQTFNNYRFTYNEEITYGVMAYPNNDPSNLNQNNTGNNASTNQVLSDEVNNIITNERYLFRWDKLQYVAIPYGIAVFIAFLRETFVSPCGLFYWMLIIIFAAVVIFYDYTGMKNVKGDFLYKNSINFPFDNKDIKWDNNTIYKLFIVSFAAGFLAGAVGIGGGVIIGPILANLAIYPVVCSVNTNVLVFINTSAVAMQFLFFNILNYSYGLITVISAAVGSFFTTMYVNKLILRTGRQSLIYLLLFSVVAISAVILPLTSIIRLFSDLFNGREILYFNMECDP